MKIQCQCCNSMYRDAQIESLYPKYNDGQGHIMRSPVMNCRGCGAGHSALQEIEA